MNRNSSAEAWLTSVKDNESVSSALVLAESLRRSNTTKLVGVILSDNVTKDARNVLRKVFDAVFLMDEILVPKGNLTEDERMKIFAFSLKFFQTCVFVSPNSLVLENADQLFNGRKLFCALKGHKRDGMDMSVFKFAPNLELCEYLSSTVNQNGKFVSGKYMKKWFENQPGSLGFSFIEENFVLKFSVKNVSMMREETHAPIIQFVDIPKQGNLEGQLAPLITSGIGFFEKKIVGAWMEIYDQQVVQRLKNPNTNAFASGYDENKDEVFANEPIAIIGMSCRYPGANNIEEFWNLLFQGEEGIREPPAFRWVKEHCIRVSPEDRKSQAGFLATTVDEFDAKFFGISPKEATFLDPQTRLLHEVLWESLESSGTDPLSLSGTNTGIFTGSWMNNYTDIINQKSSEKDFFRTYMGNSIGGAAARLSFLLGLTGPSIATESGCSSAIVAVDLAVKSLRSGQSNLALACGVNLLLHPFNSNLMDYVISKNGRCKTFDANADGFGRAEGCGVLVLKRLSDALRDRDNIWAMIRGSAISQEGVSKSMGTPTIHCEALAMTLSLEDANVKPERVSYIETHGTGTAVGDPLEVAAIEKAYGNSNRKSPLIIGSVKTNVGHTESCSGITGIMKTVLAMQHELIPKHLNLETLNPEIHLNRIPADIPMEPISWPKTEVPRIAGVSSFGITGTDGHVIIQEAPNVELPRFDLGIERPLHIMKIAAKSSEALEEMLKLYDDLFIQRQDNECAGDFADAAFTANTGRASFPHRAFIVAENYNMAHNIIQSNQVVQGEANEPGKICFLFTGQGSQYLGMANVLYKTSPTFRIHFDACDKTLREQYNLSICDTLWESDPNSKELSRTIYSQTSIFCVEYCLLKLWESWGITPDYVLGHSLGEFAAAVAAGILGFRDALKLVAERSCLIEALPKGSMLVIKASKSQVDKLLNSSGVDLDIAAVNSPEQTVVAGDTNEVLRFSEYCKKNDLKCIILEATHAFHSRHMEPMLEEYRKIAETITYKSGKECLYVSGMEGKILEASAINANYWVRHTREKVSFMGASEALREHDCVNFLEVGPQPILSSFIMLNNEDRQLNCLASLRRGTNDWQTILTTLGKLFVSGRQVNWKGFDAKYKRHRVALPFHPFHRKSYWIESSGSTAALIHPLLGYSMSNASTLSIFQNDLSLKSVPYIKDHCIGSRIVFPGAGFSEICLSAGVAVSTGVSETLEKLRRPVKIENFRIDAPLQLSETKPCKLQVIVDLPSDKSDDHNGFRVKVFHQGTSEENSGKWILHATANFSPVVSSADAFRLWNLDRIKDIMSTESSGVDIFYKKVDDTGLRFGETFKSLQNYWLKNYGVKHVDEAVAEVKIPADYSKYVMHPLIIDAMFQAGILTKHRYTSNIKNLQVPVRVGELVVFPTDINPDDDKLFIYAGVEQNVHFAFVMTQNLQPVVFMNDVELAETTVKTIESVLEQQNSSMPDAWEEVWKPVAGSSVSHKLDLPELESIVNSSEVANKIMENTLSSDEATLVEKTDRLIYLYIVKALYELDWKPQTGETVTLLEFCQKHHILDQFQQLVCFYFTMFEEEGFMKYDISSDTWTIINPPSKQSIEREINKVLPDLRGQSVLENYTFIANYLSKILTGAEPALSLLFPVEESKQKYSVAEYYLNHPSRSDVLAKITVVLTSIIETIKSANNGTEKTLKVLEVGAGTGSLSKVFLEEMTIIWGTNFEYYYTDLSPSFFNKAEKTCGNFKKNLKFEVFNIENNALGQGIPLNYFDIVVATDVIHAVRNLEESLAIIRQTMRTDAYLVFTETLGPSRPITYLFGLLEGYWRFEDFDWRPRHSCVDGKVWESILKKCGFGFTHVVETYFGVNGIISGQTVPYNHSRYISPIVNDRKINNEKKDWIVFAPSGEDGNVTAKVVDTLKCSDYNVEVVLKLQTPEEVSQKIKALFKDRTLEGIIYAWGMDVHENDQQNVSLPLLHLVQQILELQIATPRLYVITQGIVPITDALFCNPTPATLFGMVRALKNENVGIFVRSIDLDYESGVENKVEQILFEIAMKGSSDSVRGQAVAYRGHVRYEPKLTKLNLQAANAPLQLPQSVEKFQLVLPKTRMINDLEFDALVACDMADEEIEVKVKSYALNFKDILTILKPNEEFEKLKTVGLDFSGVVTKIGKGVSAETIKVGDRVFGCNFKEGALQSHLVQSADSVLPIPEKMSFWEASTLPAVFATSYYCLTTTAKMKAGDTVLIHTGSGGVGLSAIQLAQHVGATIITTAGSPRKRAYLRSLGIEHVFHSRNTDYEQEISRVTNGKGVDIVLNSITGPGFKEASLNSCAKNARFVEMSKLGIWTDEEVATRRADVQYTIVDLTVLNGDEWKRLLSNMKVFLEKGNIKAIPFVKFDALHIRQALQYFQKAKHIGKVVCTMPEVKVREGKFTVNTPLYNNESTYLITGGLGGIGFEVCKWMLEKGATDIVLTARNPPKEELLKKIEDINSKGFNVMIKYADVGDMAQMKSLIHDISQSCKPLRGVMHCAGVLRDNIYPNQNWECFEATFNAKVNGTWNLHNLTKNLPLEHFVFYSSITALIGSPGQPNHSGANSFEDAFTHYRHSLGLPATAINWGQWAEVGVAKEIHVAGFAPISVKRMLNGLETAIQTQRIQTSFCEFDNLSTLYLLCPTVKTYLDERIWKQYGDNKQSVENLSSEVFWKELDESETKDGKIQIISGHLKRILRVALRLDSEDAIKDDGNLQDYGVDSLMSIEMKNNIQSLLGQRVTITASVLKNCTTVREIATAIASKIMGEDEESTVISPEELGELLKSDCVLPEDIKPSADCATFTKPSDIKTVFVTGCTGQLAPYILKELTSSYKSITNIVCLVRAKETVLPIERLVATLKSMNLSVDLSNVRCVRGDVSSPQFGLEKDKYNELCGSIDAIIHCSVKSNHIEPYCKADNGTSDIRSVNVGGLLNVLEFASTTKVKHIYHASAFSSIFGSNSDGTLSDEWPCEEEIKVITEHSLPGYQVSKFVCEMLLKEAVARGIPCKVFRFPWITGEKNSGRLNYINNHFILRLLSYLKLKAMPSLPFPAQVLPVDTCAEWSLKLFLRDDIPFEVYNIGHPSPELEQEFTQVASCDFGIELDLIELEEFSERLQKCSPLEALKELYTDVARITAIYTSDSFKSVKGYYEAPATFFENKKLQKYLPGFAEALPSSTEILRRNMNFIKSTGFLKKIEISTI